MNLSNYNGIINLDSKEGKEIDFVSSKFEGWLWKENNTITISFIQSKNPHCGNFKRLIEDIRSKGFKVQIPTPLGRMQDIVLKNNYQHKKIKSKSMGLIDVWELKSL